MSFKRALRVLFCGLFSFFRTLTTFCSRVLRELRLRYTPQINMSGDECEFDSTWEDEDERKTPRKKVFQRRSRRNMFAAKDMQDFRHSCRGLDDDKISDDDGAGEHHKGRFYNLDFYHGKLRSSPDNLFIDDFHQNWWREYDLLEDVHSYIQWLFPIQEPGVNWKAHVLSKKEIMLFRKDKEARSKLVKSYKLMLDFYGMRLVDESTGEVARAPHWMDRFKNLNRYTHNNLRITRILKCLGTLGLKHYQAPLVRFFLYETLVMEQLQNVKQSALDYFMFTVLEKSERRELIKYAFKHFKPQEHFVWGPKKILLSHVAHCKKENVDQPTENKQSSVAEDQQERVNPRESKNKMNKFEARRSPGKMQSKKDHQNKNEPVIPNKLTETSSDQGANKSSQCSSEHEDVGKKKQDLSVGVNDGVDDGDDNKNIASCHGPDREMRDKTDDKESKDKQKRVNSIESTHEMKKIDANLPPEEMESKKYHQNKDEPVIPNKLMESNSDQGANKRSQCSSENEDVKKKNQDLSVGVNDGVGDGDDNKNIVSCHGLDIEMRDETDDKESKDEQKRVNSIESTHEMKKIDAKLPPEGMECTKDHQNKDEPVIPNKLMETNIDQGANKRSQCSSENEDVKKINQDLSVCVNDGVGVGDGDGDDNKNIASCQVPGIEMKDNTKDKESEDKQKRVNPHESEHEMKKTDASHPPEGMESKKNHQNKDEPVIPNKLSETNSDQRAIESSQCSSENEDVVKQKCDMSVSDDDDNGVDDGLSVSDDNKNTTSKSHDAANGSYQIEEGCSCHGHDVEMEEEPENIH